MWAAMYTVIRATVAEAPPPRPFNRATIWGIWIINTLTDIHTPRAEPTIRPAQITGIVSTLASTMVTMIAPAMEAALIKLPFTAVSGEFSRRMP